MCLKSCKCIISATVSILIGVAVGILFFVGILTNIVAAIIIALIFAALALLFLTIIGASKKEDKCVCKIGKCALIGAILTIILGLVAVVLAVSAGSIGFAILIGLLGAAFFFTVFTIAEIIACILECDYEYNCK